MNISLRHIAALAVIALGAASFAGCAAQPEPTDSTEEDVGDAEEALGTCCSEGYYRCASNGFIEEYGQPGCGLPKKTVAASACKSACHNVACIDSGWRNVCL